MAGETQSARTLRASLDYERSHVSIRWAIDDDKDDGFERYEIRLADLDRCTNDIRRHLDRLQKMPVLAAAAADQYRPVLRDLAGAGAALYKLLMTGVEGDPLSEPAATDFREWFEEHVIGSDDTQWRIQFVHPENAKIIVPWGLVFTPDPNKPIDQLGVSHEDFLSFWSMAHRVTCSIVTPPNVAPDNLRRENVKLSSFMETDDHLASFTIEQLADRGHRERLQQALPETPVAARKRARELRKFDQFWYIWLKSVQGSQEYGDEGSHLSAEDLQLELGGTDRTDDRIVFLLLDGDAVIRKDRGPDWLATALKFGRSGLIAVEADISNSELKCFGWSIFRHVLSSRRPFMEAMGDARRQLWPQSLLFGVYCDPSDAYADPPDERTILAMDAYIDAMGYEIHKWDEQ